jgi:hypothetical protein
MMNGILKPGFLEGFHIRKEGQIFGGTSSIPNSKDPAVALTILPPVESAESSKMLMTIWNNDLIPTQTSPEQLACLEDWNHMESSSHVEKTSS